jgi:hypothetical protein
MRAPLPAMAVVMAAARATAMLVMPTGLSLSRDEPGGKAGRHTRFSAFNSDRKDPNRTLPGEAR